MDKSVINLKSYKKSKKDRWLARNHQKMTIFIADFLATHFSISYIKIAEIYQSLKHSQAEEAWDYIDLREIIQQTIEQNLCEQTYSALKRCSWFDCRLFSRDEIVEYCLNTYIMSSVDEDSSGQKV